LSSKLAAPAVGLEPASVALTPYGSQSLERFAAWLPLLDELRTIDWRKIRENLKILEPILMKV